MAASGEPTANAGARRSSTTTSSTSSILLEKKNDSSTEKDFMAAIYDGNIATFLEILNCPEEYDLNLEYKDNNGNTPLQACIQEGYSAMVDQLLKQTVYVGDALLRAVDVGYIPTVTAITEYASRLPTSEERVRVMDCHCDDDDFHPDVTPMVLAAQRNDFAIVKLLSDFGCTIVDVASKDFSTSATDALQQSVGTLEIYKGLASEAYAALATADPVDYAFTLSDRLQKLSKIDVSFKTYYLELVDVLNHFATDIISHARNTEEILTVLSYHERKGGDDKENTTLGPLPKLSRAIKFNQREFVAHPNCQQTVKSKFYGRLSYLRDYSSLNRLLVFLTVIVTFPLLSLLYLCLSTSPRIKNTIGCPYIKLTMHLASDVFFVAILTADTVLNGGVESYKNLSLPTRQLLLLWIIGIAFQQAKVIKKKELCTLNLMKHVRDILIVILFLSVIILDASYTIPENEEQYVKNAKRSVGSQTVPFQPDGTDYTLSYPKDTNESYFHIEQELVLHPVPVIPVNRKRKVNPGQNSDKNGDEIQKTFVTEEAFRIYLDYNWWHPRLIARSLYALATVMTILRIFPYVVISDIIGPLQISLGSMVWQTLHVLAVFAVILIACSVGLTYMYSYYDEVKFQTCVNLHGTDSCRSGSFRNLLSGMMFLYWSLLGLETTDSLNLDDQARVFERTGYALYAVFYVLLVLVCFSMLIAVMTNVYNKVEENADVEWKFATTSMWMRFIQEGNVVPPPFNIIPSIAYIMHLYSELKHKSQGRKPVRPRPKSNTKDQSAYQRVIACLVERFVVAKTAGEVSVEKDVSDDDIRALRNDLLSLKLEIFQHLQDTTIDIGNTIGRSVSIKLKSQRANTIFSKTEELYSMVGGQMEMALDVKAKIAENNQEEERLRREQDKIKFADDCTQTEANSFQVDMCTQTISYFRVEKPPRPSTTEHNLESVPQKIAFYQRRSQTGRDKGKKK